MSNKHASKQHGAAQVNEQRPKSKLRKRNNKHRSVAKKMEIIEERRAADKAPAKKAEPKKEAPAKEAKES